jgi:UDPglucose--hexose-1-phosphate uridylyltransferase
MQSAMSELRLNVITKEWVVIAPERSARPKQFAVQHNRPPLPEHDPACPFCPGNEAETTAEEFRVVSDGGSGWSTRVVSNRYAALSREPAAVSKHSRGLHHCVSGVGIHEVIIDTPRHDRTTAQLELTQVQDILRTYRARYRVCRADPRIAHTIIFKNHGPGAGTSLVHPHSQIVATPVVSYQVRDRIRALEDHYALFGECVLCKMIAEEIADGSRIIFRTGSFVALVPYAALSAFHIWIFPTRHMASFGELGDDEIGDLATTLRTALRQLYYGLGDPDFNYVIRSAPSACSPDDFHWYVSIVPRLGRAAGFELGSGMYVNDRYPEDAAQLLRSVQIPGE